MSEKRSKINIPLLISSLLVSCFLWAAVYAQSLPVTTRPLEVDLLRDGLDANQYSALRVPSKLKVWVTGTEEQLNELRETERVGLLDLSRAQPGERLYPVNLQPPLLRDLAHDRVPEVRIMIERLLRRTIKPTPQTTGKLPTENIRLDMLVIDPPQVSVSGPESRVKEVAEARVPFELAVADPDRRAAHVRPVEVVDSRGRRMDDVDVSPAFVSVTPILQPAPEEKTASVLARFRGSVATGFEQTGYKLDSEKVVLMGPSYSLAMVSSVETQPIDVTGLRANREFTVDLKLPAGVTATRPQRVKVRVFVNRVPNRPRPPTEAPANDQAARTPSAAATTGSSS